MNKLVKGSIAGAAGIALLLGGVGTFAVWSDSQNLDVGTLSTGTLEITHASEGVWVEGVNNDPIADITDFRIVPGDTLAFTQNLTLAVSGDNLKFEVTDNFGDLIDIPGIDVTDYVTAEVIVTGPAGIVAPVGGVYDVANGTYTIAVSIDVDVPASVVYGKNLTLDLSSATVTVTQITN